MIVTHSGERRRVTLPDDSVLYVNERTELKLASPRQVDLTHGEVFLEVAPRDDTKFVVSTPQRQITALGTKFAVRADDDESRVLVTQGKVQTGGADAPLTAGQQFIDADGTTIIDRGPRADHELDWMQEIIDIADGALIPANDKAGGALIAVDPDGQDAKLSLRKYHIDVHIEDGFARTTIDQTYFNHMHSRLEGTFYFPLPPDASLSRLAMYVGGKLMEGGMAERDYARQVFETIKTRQLDPALLEWVDGSTFKMRVFPLEPRQEKRIILSYTQKLDVSYGRTKYRFPAGHNMKVVGDWSTHIRVKDGGRLHWDSPSHELNAAKNDGDVVLTAEAKLDRLDRDLVLYLNDDSIASDTGVPPVRGTHRRDAGSTTLSTTTHENAQYLMLRWRPELPSEPIRQRRHWVFLFECSADRNPLLARTQIEIIRTILNHAEHDDTFSVVAAGPYASVMDAKPQAATAENVQHAVEALDRTHLVGALDLGNAFDSLKPLTEFTDNSVVVHVGSGVPILGEREAHRLVQMLPENAKYVGVGVGKRFNRSLMKLAAARSGGYFTQINPDESTSWRGFELVSTLNTPRLLDVKVATDSGACEMLSMQDSLADGEELCAIGRYENAKEAPTELTITGRLDGQPFTETVAVGTLARSVSEASPIPRMWAKQQIELLTSLGAEQHKDRIIALSKAMYVMSPFTSLLVLENEAMYEQYKIDRGRKDHWAIYPAPELIDVVEERSEVRGQGAEENEKRLADDGTSSKKPTVEEVLNTILVHRPAQILFLRDRGYYHSGIGTVLQALSGAYALPDMRTIRTTVTAADGGISILGGVKRSYTPLASRLYVDLNGRVNINAHGPLGTTWDAQSPFVTSVIPIIDDSGSMWERTLDQWRVPNGSMFAERYHGARGVGFGPADIDFDSLIDLITATVRLTTWEEVGGPGTVEAFPGNLSLVVSQTQSFPDNGNGYFEYIEGNALEAFLREDGAFLSDVENQKRLQTEIVRAEVELALIRSRELFDVDPDGVIAELRVVLDNLERVANIDSPVRSRLRDRIVSAVKVAQRRRVEKDETDMLTAERRAASRQRPRIVRFDSLLDQRRYRESLGGEFDLPFTADSFTARVPQFGGFDLPLRPRRRTPPWEIEASPAMRERMENLVQDIYDPEITITVDPRRPRRVRLAQPLIRFSITNRSVVDLVQFDPTEFELIGQKPGITTLTLWYEGEGDEPEIIRYLVRVAMDDDDADIQLTDEDIQWAHKLALAKREQLRGRLVQYVIARITGRIEHRDCLYQRPQFTGNDEVFRKLVSYAPAMNTSWADVQAIVEAEADVPAPLRGKVDDGARRLIERARGLGWQTVEWKDDEGKTAFRLTTNGQGQLRYERRTRHGLAETVVCDGRTLRHHYPELGLAAKRDVSRFHRAELASLVPWAVLPAGDLAVGADVRLVNARTISIIPINAEGSSSHVELQMIFAADGRLAERRVVSRPGDEVRLRVTYSRKGTVRWLSGEGEELGKLELTAKSANAPQLSPDESQLVVLPMPARERAHVLRTSGANFSDGIDYAKFSQQQALRVVAACMYDNRNDEPIRVIGQRFFARGDRRIGFYTLLLSSGRYWQTGSPVDVGREKAVLINPLKDHPDSPLAAYIAAQLKIAEDDEAADMPKLAGPPDSFLQQLADFRRQYRQNRGPSDPFGGDSTDEAPGDVDEAIALVQRLHSPELRWAMLDRLQTHTQNGDACRRYADAYERLENDPVLGYLARYEHARALLGVADPAASRKKFTAWYDETLAAGMLPRIDSDFRRASQYVGDEGNPIGWGGDLGWTEFVHKASRKLVEQGRRPTVLTLAWQCHQLGNDDLGSGLLGVALAGAEPGDRFAVSLAGIEYLAATGQHARALVLLEPLLADDDTAQMSSLWRLGAALAQQQGMTARSAKMLEQALALEYEALDASDVVNLEKLRSDYGELLRRYGELATALASLEEEPSPELLARLVGAADRWRGMEDDVTQPCHQVARIFSTLGADALAWQYVTTPLAARPNEASPWVELAVAMKGESNFAMADRAYSEAFRSEGSNAQILWDHAQMLSELGRYEEARKLYEQIAGGDWQPRFKHLQQQAKQLVGANR